jgi:hypothetical protein
MDMDGPITSWFESGLVAPFFIVYAAGGDETARSERKTAESLNRSASRNRFCELS